MAERSESQVSGEAEGLLGRLGSRSGSTLGRYELVRCIGRGGMAEVYEAVHRGLKKSVAIKVLQADAADNDELRARFLREGEVAAHTRHPHIVDVTDVGEEEGVPYLVMELLEGESLAHVVARGPLSISRTIDIVLPIGAALSAAHSRGVVHRDLKPENVFLAKQPNGRIVPKLVDFGVSKLRRSDGDQTAASALLGTPEYMAPEQVLGELVVDARADQYALALIVFECIAGRVPFQSKSPINVLQEVARGIKEPLSAYAKGIPEGLDLAISRALSHDREWRFPSVDDLLVQLLPFASQRGAAAYAQLTGERSEPDGVSERAIELSAERAAMPTHDLSGHTRTSRTPHEMVDPPSVRRRKDAPAVGDSSPNDANGEGRKTSDSLSEMTKSSVVEIQPIELQRFDDYLLLALIGHGGMAEIYLALHEGQNRFRKLVVIKRMRTGMRADPFVVQMFLDEARLAARFNHPHVVQTHEIGEIGGEHFLAMEYLDGQPLSKLLRRLQERDITLPAALAARIVADALDGLHYAHELTDYDGTPLHLVHRDVSPHNIFVTHEGVVKLLDFGIAKSDIQESQTRTGLIKGKFAYIAPEQARAETFDRRADLWSMGVTLWELAAGRRLFKGPSEVATLQAALSGPIPRLEEVRPGVPEPVQRVIDHALQRDPDMRLGTALEMKEILEEWLEGQGNAGTRNALRDLMKEAFGAEMQTRRQLIRDLVGQIPKDVAGQTGRFSALSVSSIAGLPSVEGTPSAVRVVDEPATRVAGARSLTHSSESVVSPLADRSSRRDRVRRTAVAALLAGLAVFAVVVGVLLAERSNPDDTSPAAIAPTSESASGVAVIADTDAAVVEDDAAAAEPPVAEAPPDDEPEAVAHEARPPTTKVRSSRRGSEETSIAGTAGAVPEMIPTPPPEPQPAAATGRLQLDAAPYAIVFLGSRRLGITPVDVELPAGPHTLTLRNPEQGIETTYRVTVAAGEVTSRRVSLE